MKIVFIEWLSIYLSIYLSIFMPLTPPPSPKASCSTSQGSINTANDDNNNSNNSNKKKSLFSTAFFYHSPPNNKNANVRRLWKKQYHHNRHPNDRPTDRPTDRLADRPAAPQRKRRSTTTFASSLSLVSNTEELCAALHLQVRRFNSCRECALLNVGRVTGG